MKSLLLEALARTLEDPVIALSNPFHTLSRLGHECSLHPIISLRWSPLKVNPSVTPGRASPVSLANLFREPS